MADILEKVSDWKKHPDDYLVWDLLEEASGEIERLRRERDELIRIVADRNPENAKLRSEPRQTDLEEFL